MIEFANKIPLIYNNSKFNINALLIMGENQTTATFSYGEKIWAVVVPEFFESEEMML